MAGIHGHADGEEETGDARQGQHHGDQLEDGDVQGDVEDQGDVRQEAGQAVEDQHEDQHHDQADDPGPQALLHRVLAQAGPDGAHVDDLQGHGQGAVAHLDGQALRLLLGEVAGDLAAAPDGRVDAGSGEHLPIQDDGQLVADVRLGVLVELVRAVAGQLEVDLPLAVLVLGGHRVAQDVTGHGRLEDPVRVRDGALFHEPLFHGLLGLGHRVGPVGGVDDHARLEDSIPGVHELQLACGADGLDGPVRVLDARQLHDDATVALELDVGLGHAQAVDPALHDELGRAHGSRVQRLVRGHIRLQQDLGAALQIQTQGQVLQVSGHIAVPGHRFFQPGGVVNGQSDVEREEEKQDDSRQDSVVVTH